MKRLIAILVLLTGFGPNSWATCSVVQAIQHNVCGTASVTCSVVAGDGLATIGAGHAVAIWQGSATTGITLTSVSDSGGSTYGTCANCAGATTGASTDIQYTLSALSSTSGTCNRSASGTAWSCGVVEVSTTSSLSYDTSNNINDSTIANPQPGVSLTLTGGNDCIAQAIAAGNNVSSVTTYTLQASGVQRSVATLANTASGTAPSFTLSATARASVSALALKESGAPPPSKNSMLPLLGVGN